MPINIVKMNVCASEIGTNTWHKIQQQWQRIRQLTPSQRRTAAITTISFLVSIVLIAQLSSSQAETGRGRKRRDLDSINLSDDATGATYVRWGRTECPAESRLVYHGVAGGSHYTNSGGGANYVCLPLNPDYEDLATAIYRADMYGTEYECLDFVSGKTTQDHNVPCAVCQSTERSNMLMIPAKNVCPPTWHMEYNGYLVADYYRHANNKVFECLDHMPETDQSGYRNENGALMYAVQGKCGSLPCPEYVEGKRLTCAVCTK